LSAEILEDAQVDLRTLSFPDRVRFGQPIQEWSRPLLVADELAAVSRAIV